MKKSNIKKILMLLTGLAMTGASMAKIYYVPNPVGGNNRKAIQDCINKLRSGDVLKFPYKKVYNYNASDIGNTEPCFAFRALAQKNVKIDGNGSTLRFNDRSWWNDRNPVFNFHAGNSNIRIENLNFDWDVTKLPWARVKVVSVNSSVMVVEMLGNHKPITGMTIETIDEWDSKDAKPALNSYHFVSSTDYNSISNNAFTYKLNSKRMSFPMKGYKAQYAHNVIEKDDHLIIAYKKFNNSIFQMMGADRIYLKNIDINNAAGSAVNAWGASNLFFDDVDIAPRAGYHRSINSDGFRIYSCRGEVSIKNCTTTHTGDDGANLHTKYWNVKKTGRDAKGFYVEFTNPGVGSGAASYPFVGPYQSALPGTRGILPANNDWISLSKKADAFAVKEVLQVKEVVGPFNQALSVLKVYFKNSPKTSFVAGDFGINNSATPHKFNYENNRVQSIMSRGIVYAGIANTAVIKNNTFKWTSAPGIFLGADVVWFKEGPSPNKVDVINNTITECNYGHHQGSGLITASNYRRDANNNIVPSNACPILKVKLIGNTIRGMKAAGVKHQVAFGLDNIQQVDIEDTKFNGNLTDRFIGKYNCCEIKVHRNKKDEYKPYNNLSIRDYRAYNIQAEHFDNGGEFISYYDKHQGNNGGKVRTGTDVDVYLSGGRYFVASWACGEWLNYSFNTNVKARYNISLMVYGTSAAAKVHLEQNGSTIAGTNKTIPKSQRRWFQVTFYNVVLEAGNNTIKLVSDEGDFMLDYITVKRTSVIRVVQPPNMRRTADEFTDEDAQVAFEAYPNPNNGIFNVNLPKLQSTEKLNVFNGQGKLILSQDANAELGYVEVDLSAFPAGVYTLKYAEHITRISKL